MSTNPRPYLLAAGFSEADLTPMMLDPSRWDLELVIAQIENHNDPSSAARRAKRAGPGAARAEKMHQARVAWLADATD